jgi:hypothetical protein
MCIVLTQIRGDVSSYIFVVRAFSLSALAATAIKQKKEKNKENGYALLNTTGVLFVEGGSTTVVAN